MSNQSSMWKTLGMTPAATTGAPEGAAPAPTEAPSGSGKKKKKKKFPWGFVVLAGVVLFGVGSCLTSLFSGLPPPVESNTVLEIDLEATLREVPPTDALGIALGRRAPTLRDIVDALDRGARDPDVVGLVARVGRGGSGLAAAQEVRDAVERFKASGRFTVAWAESFGDLTPALGGYYVASAFDEVWLVPTGALGFVGLSAEVPFLKGTLDKVGVEPQMDSRHEFKTAKDLYTETAFTDAHRTSLERLLRSAQDQIVAGIAASRDLEPAQVNALLESGPYDAPAALETKLVDNLGYRDEVLARVVERAGGEANRLFPLAYLDRTSRPNDTGEVFALVYGVGQVVRGAQGMEPFGGDAIAADNVSANIRAAVADEEVRAIVLRVDSPGGSHVASDVIRREMALAREAGKPVVLSMGNVAASGGYYIATGADRIVAQPGTITGSIGVVGGKLVPTGLFEKLGLSFGLIELTPRAGMFAMSRGFTDDEKQVFGRTLDFIYDDFVAKAAAARGMEPAQLEPLARGRVWTGADAKERGLVDALGGLHEAVAVARELVGLSEDAPVELRRFPRERRPLEALLAALEERPRENSDDPGAGGLQLSRLRAMSRTLRDLGLAPRAGVMEVPPALRVLEGL
jgi:protease-4